MRLIHNDAVLGTSVAILAALGCWKTIGLSSESRLFPLLVLGPAVLIGIIIAIRGQIRLIKNNDNPHFFLSPGSFFLVVGVIFFALLGVQFLGFLTTSAIIIPLLSYILGYRKFLPVLTTTLIFLVMVYIVFIQLLSRPLPAEIWFNIIGS